MSDRRPTEPARPSLLTWARLFLLLSALGHLGQMIMLSSRPNPDPIAVAAQGALAVGVAGLAHLMARPHLRLWRLATLSQTIGLVATWVGQLPGLSLPFTIAMTATQLAAAVTLIIRPVRRWHTRSSPTGHGTDVGESQLGGTLADRRPVSTRLTRVQQGMTIGYGIWSAVLTVVIAVVLRTPERMAAAMREQGYPPHDIAAHVSPTAYHSGMLGAGATAGLCVLIIIGAVRLSRWSFWLAVIWYTVTGAGALWVPLRPQAHLGETGWTLIIHAWLNDAPGLAVAATLVAGLLWYRHTWARRQRRTADRGTV